MKVFLKNYINYQFKGKTIYELLRDLDCTNYTLAMELVEHFSEYEDILKTYLDKNVTEESLIDNWEFLQSEKRRVRDYVLEEEEVRKRELKEARREALEKIHQERMERERNRTKMGDRCIDFGGNNYHGFKNRYKKK